MTTRLPRLLVRDLRDVVALKLAGHSRRTLVLWVLLCVVLLVSVARYNPAMLPYLLDVGFATGAVYFLLFYLRHHVLLPVTATLHRLVRRTASYLWLQRECLRWGLQTITRRIVRRPVLG